MPRMSRETAEPLLALLLVGICAVSGEFAKRAADRQGPTAKQARAWVNLGLASIQEQGDPETAKVCWETALTYPTGSGYWHFLAHVNLRKLAQVENREEDMLWHNREVQRLARERRERLMRYWEGRWWPTERGE